MESPFALCPGCESLLRGDEAQCPNCGMDLTSGSLEPATPAPGADPARPPAYNYRVQRAQGDRELEDLLNAAGREGWQPLSVYFGWRTPDGEAVHFVVLHRRAS